jgi:CheY-like chemotaxis protein
MADSISIPILNKVIGGILPGRSYYFRGEPGSGKTVLGLQMAQSWARAGKTILYLTAEKPEDLIEHAESLGLGLGNYLASDRILIGSYLDEAPSQFDSLGAAGFKVRLEELQKSHDISAVIFDPIEQLAGGMGGRNRQRVMTENLVEQFSDLGWSAFFLADARLDKKLSGVDQALRSRCWVTMSMGPERDPFSIWKLWRRRRPEEVFSLRIEKSRQPTPNGHQVPYQIAAGAGLIPAWEAEGDHGAANEGAGLIHKPRILLATGDAKLLKPLESLLGSAVVTRCVGTGVDALTQAVTWHPQVVVAEIDLPELSGLAVTRALRQGRYAMPVILITRKKQRQSERIRAFLNGATDFVHFPLDPIELAYRIRVASRLRLTSFNDGTEEQMLEVLLKQANSHVLDRPTFLQALSLSLIHSNHLSSPNSLVTFKFSDPKGSESGQPAVWRSFLTILDQQTRAGDLITYPDHDTAVVLLGHELRRGVSMFLGRLSEKLAKENFGRFDTNRDWWIETVTRTIELPDEGELDPNSLFSIEGESMERFYSAGSTDGAKKEDAEAGVQRKSKKRRKRA